jgi:hypothetical protein
MRDGFQKGWMVFLTLLPLGCLQPVLHAPEEGAPALPQARAFRQGAIFFHSDSEISPEHPLFLELSRFPESVCRELQLPVRDQLIHVYLFGQRSAYEQYVAHQYQDVPSRRALFILQRGTGEIGSGQINGEMQVLAFWGDRIQDDLRHELTHATLHGVMQNVPLWLDEGLAMYFECGLAASGKNSRVLEALESPLAQGTWRLNLERLETLHELKQMSLADYREAWAWVHYLLHSSPDNRRVLLAYLRQPAPGSLAVLLRGRDAGLDQHVIEHVRHLQAERTQWPHQ